MAKKLWGGRFAKKTAELMDEFNASIGFDQKMYRQDIMGSTAHAKMLAKQGIISQEDCDQIVSGLAQILEDIEAGNFEFRTDLEDIHMNVESVLTERIGEAGKRLHTARSRNDQVAVDFRMYMKEEILAIEELIADLKKVIIGVAEANRETVMPGYTHLQRAQPVTLAYYVMAYYQMFKRDGERFEDCFKRTDYLPLGCGALAGTTYNTDRQFLAEELGFEHLCENAMDAVSDRDFALEFLSDCSILMMHLSRFCEELVVWSSSEFSFVEMDDAYSTGSSIMPQKKNPDVAELIRGKTGRTYGNMMTLFTIMKSLTLAYNKDMQEDKPPVFDSAETVRISLQIFTDMLRTLNFKKDNMEAAARKGFTNATDAADYLVSKGLPFRECHEIIGNIVLDCLKKGIGIEELSLEELKGYSDKFEEDVYEKIDIRSCIAAKKSYGSTSFESVENMIRLAKEEMEE